MYSTQPTLEVLVRLCSYPLRGWGQCLRQALQGWLGMITPLEGSAVNQAAMWIAPGTLLNLSMFVKSEHTLLPSNLGPPSRLHLVTASCYSIYCLHAFIIDCMYCFSSGDPLVLTQNLDGPFNLCTQGLSQDLHSILCS